MHSRHHFDLSDHADSLHSSGVSRFLQFSVVFAFFPYKPRRSNRIRAVLRESLRFYTRNAH
ncbi:hypothetical protein AB870_11210 [Pandoraea faecigallinarum]|uniref:Uncharacterized protein n=1 Tax=Pandoraea faecigallinarum TaxID=656179 RepID=A0A0H3WVA4_9BURK|nr:hypothetical protein AB870_11210 [Pandoraea faecigallinarum]